MSENTEELKLDLLIKQAVYGLTAEETAQLRDIGGDSEDAASLEATAAMIAMTDIDADEQMPAHVLATRRTNILRRSPLIKAGMPTVRASSPEFRRDVQCWTGLVGRSLPSPASH